MTLDDFLSELIGLREWVDTFVKEALENTPEPVESLS